MGLLGSGGGLTPAHGDLVTRPHSTAAFNTRLRTPYALRTVEGESPELLSSASQARTSIAVMRPS